jgi:hypothetical protein
VAGDDLLLPDGGSGDGADAACFSGDAPSGRLFGRRRIAIVTVPSDIESPPFNSFLLWYAILHCVGAVALFAMVTAAGALMVAFGFVDLAMIERRAVEI